MDDYKKYTSDILLPAMVSETQFGSPVASYLFKDAEESKTDKIRRAVQVEDSTQATSYYGAFQANTVEENLVQNINLEFKDYLTEVTVNRSEIIRGQAVNSNVFDISSVKGNLAVAGLKKRLYTDMYGDGTGNGGKNINGLENIIDDGSIAPTYGELSRLTYPALNSFVDTIGTLTLEDMVNAWNQSKYDNQTANMVIVNQTTLLNTIEAFLSDKQQNMVITKAFSDNSMMKNPGLSGFLGYETLHFKGAPVIGDRYCLEDRVYFVNSGFMNFSYLDTAVDIFGDVKPNFGNFKIEGGDMTDINPLGVSASDFKTAPGGTAFTATAHMTLQLDGDPRYHAKLIVG